MKSFYKICRRAPISAIIFIIVLMLMPNVNTGMMFIIFLLGLLVFGVGEIVNILYEIKNCLTDDIAHKDKESEEIAS